MTFTRTLAVAVYFLTALPATAVIVDPRRHLGW